MNIVFGRLPQTDERSLGFTLNTQGLKEQNTVYPFPEPLELNQGKLGMCVLASIGYDLALAPDYVWGVTIPKLVPYYYLAQQRDSFPGGEYPRAVPQKAGTSILAGMKVIKELGYFDEYRWVYNVQDLALGVGAISPAIIGVNWYSGMMKPNKYGTIEPKGKILGGHAICVRGVSFKAGGTFILQNTWGKKWGVAGGCCMLSFENMNRLLSENGEAVFATKRNSNLKTFK